MCAALRSNRFRDTERFSPVPIAVPFICGGLSREDVVEEKVGEREEDLWRVRNECVDEYTFRIEVHPAGGNYEIGGCAP